MGRATEAAVPRAVHLACVWEATARKVGNVHPTAPFADLTYIDFVLAAGEIREILGRAPQTRGSEATRTTLGRLIQTAVVETRAVVRTNPNLGIVLLLAPLAAVRFDSPDPRRDLAEVLGGLTLTDTRYLYQAIRDANPGGLGAAAEEDVREEPTVTPVEAMRLAADRDLIARQYANGFADVFDFGAPAFTDAYAKFGSVEAAIIDSQLRWLARYADSHIARKNGPEIAADVQRRAAEVLQLGGIATPEGRAAGVALDKHLRTAGNALNPGTIADLITACLFVSLRENKVSPSAPFRWDVSDWL